MRTEAPPTQAAPPRRPGERWRRVLRTVGILCILGSLAIGANLAWQLWGTGYVVTRRAQADLRQELAPRIGTRDPEQADTSVRVPGRGIAILRIPAIDLDVVVVEGTDAASLAKGPGHYVDTAYPWQDEGRVGIAGHRTTYGAPFWSLDRLRPGDGIELATEYGTFTYRVTRTAITAPDGLLRNGRSVLAQTREPTLVLTTCNPRFSAAQRLIVFAARIP
ncbi:MAG TPA: sortase [Actinomycetota bacterium]|nr:sortase [Actinomycetota bacterium]